MAAYNSELFINSAIESVLNQSYENWELLICDDCSTDKTWGLVKEFEENDKRIKLFRNSNNQGYLKTFNFLLDQAEGDYITFIDSDDTILPEKLRSQLNYLLTNENVKGVGSGINRVNAGGKIFETEIFTHRHIDILEKYENTRVLDIVPGTLMIERKAIDIVGGYNEFFKNKPGEDIDWTLRLMDVIRIDNLELALYNYRLNLKSLSRKVHSDIRSRHVFDYIFFFYMERKSRNGIDSLNVMDEKSYYSFEKKIFKLYSQDKTLLDRKLTVEYLINKDYKNGLKHLRKVLPELQLLKIKTLKFITLIIVLALFPTNILALAKSRLGIKGISHRV